MQERQELKRGLKNRHIQMIALGGAIGTGLFYGSAATIGLVGPGVMLSYAIGGFFIFLVMRCMGEMTVHTPVSGAFSTFAYKYWGEMAGFISGWNYWFCYIAVSMAEITAVGIYVNYWFPDIPQWVSGFVMFLIITGINLIGVKAFGEIEFWGAIIKVLAVIVMILFGLAIIFFGFGNGGEAIGFENLYKHGGFLPKGFTGLILSLVVVTFAFGGVELIGITAGEAENPDKTIPKAINQVLYRILIFYVGSMLVLVTLFPWDKVGLTGSPFVLIFDQLGIPAAASILNIIVLTATFSAYNSCLYSNARMLFGLAEQGNAPKVLKKIGKTGVPTYCVLLSSGVVGISVILNAFLPGQVFGIVMSIAILAIIINWVMILITHNKFRKIIGPQEVAKLKFKMPFYPISNYVTMGYLIMLVILMAFLPNFRLSLYLAPVWLGVLFLAYKLKKRRKAEDTSQYFKEAN
ncbi:amino acid permease [Bacillus sp. 7884-1]|uniref:amino acid permease n=1 Tax=Bacillus sp. 7884-1 TaxID=2021693 RepID=UPI000BA6C9CA|nr:amino acid permease [Bacillus sp. 7884-1]PAE43188.1 aromatic amino acid transporter AroP [Bacillus sp. 7884-1]